ncbi:hypothetical protein BCR42DRAFT_427477 [Absidia repens]|uniref:Uncharacterized protein n=1 Tax=Absidia repens TaxID=90262 RepID=A0A1X2HZB2_9FUNG|nr:hypothetical protein BCR42DRAFT_427477 [Absidia repens]
MLLMIDFIISFITYRTHYNLAIFYHPCASPFLSLLYSLDFLHLHLLEFYNIL